jgi:hypothetical protein
MSESLTPSGAARPAGLDWHSRFEPQLQNALASRFEGDTAGGSFEKTRDGFAIRLDVAGDVRALDVELRFEDGWILCASKLPNSANKLAPMQLIGTSTKLPGGVKVGYAVNADGSPRAELRAEVPVDTGSDFAVALGAVFEGFTQAALRIASQADPLDRSAATALPASAGIAAAEPSHHDTAGAARALTDAGWTTSAREDGRLFVDLDLSDGYRQGLLEVAGDGHLHLCSELPAISGSAADVCADALAIASLLTCGWVRMVRVTFDGKLRLEVPLVPGLADAAVVSAAASLSVANRLLGDEAEILARDGVVASQYVRKCASRSRKGGPRVGAQGNGQPGLESSPAVAAVD